ncbi:Leiomodin-1 [Bienertia sinuspersici]
MMNYCGIQQNGVSSREEMMSFVSISAVGCNNTTKSDHRKDSVLCPKPRRVGARNSNEPCRPPMRWHFGHHSEHSDSRAGSELLDIILSKGVVHGGERASTPQVASSPPFFSGSPPSRVSNPLIQDARFREEKQLIPPVSPLPSSPMQTAVSGSSSSPNSSARKGGCVRANFGNNPAVRVEGFDCLDRDRRNCSIPALA